MVLWWAVTCRLCDFQRSKRWKNIGEILYIGDLFEIIAPIEFCKGRSILEDRPKFYLLFDHFFAVLEYITTYLELYITQRIIQSRSGSPRIGFYQGRKLYWTPLAASSKRRGTSVQPFKKPTANGNKYLIAGTAEIKPYWQFDRNYGFTKKIWRPRKILKKTQICIISPIFSPLLRGK